MPAFAAAMSAPPSFPPSFPPGLSALHRALADFAAPSAPVFTPFAMPEPTAASLAPEPQPDVEALVADAVAQAEARLRDKLDEEHRAALSAAVDDALAAERQEHAAEMERVLSETGAAAANAIDAGLAELRAGVAAELSSACARLLLPIAGEAVVARAVSEMAQALREALENEAAPRITVSGPRQLLDGLQARLAGAEGVQWRESTGFDLAASFDGRVVETRLAEWAEALKAALEDVS